MVFQKLDSCLALIYTKLIEKNSLEQLNEIKKPAISRFF
jgi:hypothetical protein